MTGTVSLVSRTQIFRGLVVSISLFGAFLFAPSVLATTGCNAVGWDWKHNDVHGCDLFYPAIQWMYDEGIAEGELQEILPAGEKRLFHPERPINRAEFTKLVLLGSGDRAAPPPCEENPFPDVSKNEWYAPYICAAKKKGIISGFPDGTFKPSININFANGTKILIKSFEVTTSSSDLTAIDGQELWYKPYVLAFSELMKEASSLYRMATDDERHKLTKLIFSELVMKDGNLVEYTAKPEFSILLDRTKNVVGNGGRWLT
ncbi:S-layer homology domain-containing protein [Candidatus Peribacteria bacterium]|nr:S-layer homology domain-containing protein [Candidatus Peribacteria bacterium]